MSSKASARPGRYNPDLTPWVFGIHEALDDPTVTKVVGMKSAQAAWTDGVLNNFVGKNIHISPCPMIIMFAKDGAAKEYNSEKFTPMIEATPSLATIIPVHLSRHRDNNINFKTFPGGFLKLVGSNSPSSVKSTPAPVVCIEEPDDCNENVKDQGDTITLLEERTKSYTRRKVVFGGTPTIEGISRIEAAYQLSDQRKYYVPCHHCEESHVLSWDYVRWDTDEQLNHEVFGKAKPETAYYVCPHCGGIWDDNDKNRNVKRAHELKKAGKSNVEWVPHAEFHGVAGFSWNELISPFPGSVMARLVEKFLAAEHALAQGDDTKSRAFTNNTLGLPYSYKTDLPDIEALKARAEDYAELTAPWGVLVITAGIDVQHDRVAVSIVGWGRGEESWRLYWGEIHGQTSVAEQGAWIDLDALLDKPIPHVSGTTLRIRAVSIDSSDGQTSDAVYGYVRKRMPKNYMAIKGGADQNSEREIFSSPQVAVDKDRHQKAHKYGLRPFIVGVQRAKDLILGQDAGAGRLKLIGTGPGRMHWYGSIRPDWYEQITSEIKAPHRTIRYKKVWQKKSGVRNEALDTEVYALHAARSLKINLWKEDRWLVEESRIRQPDLLNPEPITAQPENQVNEPGQIKKVQQPAAGGFFSTQKSGGFKASKW